VKPRTDDEHRTWLQLSKLKGEQGRLEYERHQLRRQLHAAISSGEYWQGPPPQELNARLEAVIKQWQRIVDEIRQIHDAGQPPPSLPASPQSLIMGGRQELGIPTMRVR
jgi:hypothetical protein